MYVTRMETNARHLEQYIQQREPAQHRISMVLSTCTQNTAILRSSVRSSVDYVATNCDMTFSCCTLHKKLDDCDRMLRLPRKVYGPPFLFRVLSFALGSRLRRSSFFEDGVRARVEQERSAWNSTLYGHRTFQGPGTKLASGPQKFPCALRTATTTAGWDAYGDWCAPPVPRAHGTLGFLSAGQLRYNERRQHTSPAYQLELDTR